MSEQIPARPHTDYEPTDEERLRYLRNGSATRDTMRWAADQIERLRAELDDAHCEPGYFNLDL